MEESTIWLIIGSVSMTGLGLALVLISKISSEKILDEHQKRAHLLLEHQKELLNHSIAILEKERERIAAELHDGLASKINVVRLLTMSQDEVTNQNRIEMRQHLDEVLQTARQISRDLYPPVLEDLGLREAINDFLSPLSRQMDISFNFYGENIQDKSRDIHLFRIIQELVQNSLKHAAASHIYITVRNTPLYTMMCIGDNGRGFDLVSVQKNSGFKSLAARSQFLGGKFKIKTNPQCGTKCLMGFRKDIAL